MRSVIMTAMLLLTMIATAAWAAEAAAPKAKAKPAPMTEQQRRDLERRIEALERKQEMEYHETDSPTGAPGAAPADPAPKPAAH